MNRPTRYLLRMALFLAAVGGVIVLLLGPLSRAFTANPPLNGLILGVLLFGIAYILRQVVLLTPEVDWINSFRTNKPQLSDPRGLRLLAPMATMLGERRDRLRLSALSMRSLLDGIGSRLDENRDLARYATGLLIFLGLLGTFWGLLETVASISGVIGELSLNGDDVATAFNNLKEGLKEPLAGMGTAFAASLFGLAGSLVLGFLDLQLGQAQNRFYNDLEEWLSSLTRLSSGAAPEEGEQPIPVYVQALLEQTAENLEELQRTLGKGEESRIAANANVIALTETLTRLTDHMRTQQEVMVKLAEGHLALKPVLARLAEGGGAVGGGMDEATRAHIRSLDIHLARLVEDAASGRDDLVGQLRNEIKLLARTVAAMGNPKA